MSLSFFYGVPSQLHMHKERLGVGGCLIIPHSRRPITNATGWSVDRSSAVPGITYIQYSRVPTSSHPLSFSHLRSKRLPPASTYATLPKPSGHLCTGQQDLERDLSDQQQQRKVYHSPRARRKEKRGKKNCNSSSPHPSIHAPTLKNQKAKSIRPSQLSYTQLPPPQSLAQETKNRPTPHINQPLLSRPIHPSLS